MSNGENLTTEAVAEMTGLPISTLRYWRSIKEQSAPPSFNIGRRVFYRRSDVEEWLQSRYEATVTS